MQLLKSEDSEKMRAVKGGKLKRQKKKQKKKKKKKRESKTGLSRDYCDSVWYEAQLLAACQLIAADI